MAKKKTAEKGEPEVVAKCDNLNEVNPNHDELITSVAQSSPESVSIKSMIRLVRGQQVMLDSDLAFLYGVETRRLNEQVKRNIERFPSDFMFQLTKEEFDFLKSQFAMSNITDSLDNKNLKSQIAISRWGGTRKLPYAFTRNGVAMLSSVLRSQTAVGVTATIHTRYSEQFLTDLKKHNEQYPEITFVQLPHKNHDRFLIIDNKAYLLGASVKDIGTGLCAVTELVASPETILEMLK